MARNDSTQTIRLDVLGRIRRKRLPHTHTHTKNFPDANNLEFLSRPDKRIANDNKKRNQCATHIQFIRAVV